MSPTRLRRRAAVLTLIVFGAGCGNPATGLLETSPATSGPESTRAPQTVVSTTLASRQQPKNPTPTTSTGFSDSGGRWCAEWATEPSCGDSTRELIELIETSTDGGTYGFILKPIGADPLVVVNADASFYPASAIKALHLAHAVRWLERTGNDVERAIPVYQASCSGTGEYTELSLSLALDRMMIASDNQITNAVQDFFGVEALNDTAASLGMSATGLHHRFGCGGPDNNPANTTTARDLAGLFEAMIESDLSPAATEFFIDSLLDITNQVTGPDGTASDDVTVRGKAGWYGTTLTIGGVIVGESDPERYVFAAFVEGARSHSPGFTIERVVSELLDAIFER